MFRDLIDTKTYVKFLRNPLSWAAFACFAAGVIFSILTLSLGKASDLAGVIKTTNRSIAIAKAHHQTNEAALLNHMAAVQLAKVSAFRLFRGYAALNLVICIAVIGIVILAVRHYLTASSTRSVIFVSLFLAVSAAAALDFYVGSGIQKIAGGIVCKRPPRKGAFWDFCSEGFEAPQSTFSRLNFTAWANALCRAATAAVVFAMLVVASSKSANGKRSNNASREAGVRSYSSPPPSCSYRYFCQIEPICGGRLQKH